MLNGFKFKLTLSCYPKLLQIKAHHTSSSLEVQYAKLHLSYTYNPILSQVLLQLESADVGRLETDYTAYNATVSLFMSQEFLHD
jgi:hypothetical protein